MRRGSKASTVSIFLKTIAFICFLHTPVTADAQTAPKDPRKALSGFCSDKSSTQAIASCLRLAFKLRYTNELSQLNTDFIVSSVRRVAEPFLTSQCDEDISNINAGLQSVQTAGVDHVSKISSCDEAGEVYTYLTDRFPSYKTCESGTYTTDKFLACLRFQPLDDVRVHSQKIWSVLLGSYEPNRQVVEYKLPQIFWLIAANEYAPAYRGGNSPIILNLRKSVDECINGKGPSHQVFASPLVEAYVSATRDGSARNSITCSDVAKYLLNAGLVSSSEVGGFLTSNSAGADFNRCSPERARMNPVLSEIKSATRDDATKLICDKENWQFMTGVGQIFGELSQKGNICALSGLGISVAQIGVDYIPEICRLTAEGAASCSGGIEARCTAADASRSFIDCAGKNVGVRTVSNYRYDTKDCGWKLSNMKLVPNSARTIEGYR